MNACLARLCSARFRHFHHPGALLWLLIKSLFGFNVCIVSDLRQFVGDKLQMCLRLFFASLARLEPTIKFFLKSEFNCLVGKIGKC